MQEFVAVVEAKGQSFDVRGFSFDADMFGRKAFMSVVASGRGDFDEVSVVGVFDAAEFDAMEGSQPERW